MNLTFYFTVDVCTFDAEENPEVGGLTTKYAVVQEGALTAYEASCLVEDETCILAESQTATLSCPDHDQDPELTCRKSLDGVAWYPQQPADCCRFN